MAMSAMLRSRGPFTFGAPAGVMLLAVRTCMSSCSTRAIRSTATAEATRSTSTRAQADESFRGRAADNWCNRGDLGRSRERSRCTSWPRTGWRWSIISGAARATKWSTSQRGHGLHVKYAERRPAMRWATSAGLR
jgi:hypothetical protein